MFILLMREEEMPDEVYEPWGAPEGVEVIYSSGGTVEAPDDWT